MKKASIFFISLAMTATMTACGTSSSSSSDAAETTETTVILSETVEQTEKIKTEKIKEVENEKTKVNTDAEFSVEILSNEIKKNSDGEFILIIEYNFTNNSGEPEAFMYSCYDKVFQNGVECITAYFTDGIDVSAKRNEVQSGYSSSFKIAYELQDVDSPVEVKVTKFLFNDIVYLDETIDLTEAKEGFEQYAAENPDTSIKISSLSTSSDYQGNPVLIVEYEYYNGEDDAKSFTFACQDKAFQNGIECSTAIGCNDIDSQLQLNDVQPKNSLTLKVGYVLYDTSTPVNIVVTDFFGKKEIINDTVNFK